MEDATRRHFFHHAKDEFEGERRDCHWCQLRSFATHKSIPITIVNDCDDSVLPPGFRFIDDRILGRGVKPAEDSFRSGCSCAHDGDCQFSGCHCLADLDDEDDVEEEEGEWDDELYVDTNRGNAGTPKKAYAYHARGLKAGHLRSKLHDSKVPLYECHQGCACSNDCPNRVVERGRTIPLQIFRTEERGWGTF
jgi:histone-lysine N-methyltransferase SUV39H